MGARCEGKKETVRKERSSQFRTTLAPSPRPTFPQYVRAVPWTPTPTRACPPAHFSATSTPTPAHAASTQWKVPTCATSLGTVRTVLRTKWKAPKYTKRQGTSFLTYRHLRPRSHVSQVPHVPSWNPRTRPVAPVRSFPSLPKPTTASLFVRRRFSSSQSPLHSRLPFPAAVILLSSSSAGDPLIATSNRPSPCPFVGPTDLQYCDCESFAFFARLHHSIDASDPAVANNPPPVPSFPTALATQIAFAYPLLATDRTPRKESFISDREQLQSATIVFLPTPSKIWWVLPRLMSVMKSPAAKSDRVFLSLT
ncbi:hypothetical protein BDP55DRAFT_631478 [Colletotrichum godetiae]|uniref:Uncharacterized protein n=1 Tax=Colletotrichum godetiae TaxID=1209918 RepID=A0AAJ0EYK5_9PEZI|nr:uncharacterized protein BDP55DRAFT_631478 [Colletotrichum godetiae]KAK1676315.1 hypothetical protein BDP55DRAFT_631478 [Colletotrichum godetiae]